jgi:hypothetical protein
VLPQGFFDEGAAARQVLLQIEGHRCTKRQRSAVARRAGVGPAATVLRRVVALFL